MSVRGSSVCLSSSSLRGRRSTRRAPSPPDVDELRGLLAEQATRDGEVGAAAVTRRTFRRGDRFTRVIGRVGCIHSHRSLRACWHAGLREQDIQSSEESKKTLRPASGKPPCPTPRLDAGNRMVVKDVPIGLWPVRDRPHRAFGQRHRRPGRLVRPAYFLAGVAVGSLASVIAGVALGLRWLSWSW